MENEKKCKRMHKKVMDAWKKLCKTTKNAEGMGGGPDPAGKRERCKIVILTKEKQIPHLEHPLCKGGGAGFVHFGYFAGSLG